MALYMTDTQLGWVAGFLEGEGCFYIRRNGKWHYPSIRVQSVDVDALEKLRNFTGVGWVYGPYEPRRNGISKQRYWCWALDSRDQVNMLLKKILPLMSQRRAKRIKEILNGTTKGK